MPIIETCHFVQCVYSACYAATLQCKNECSYSCLCVMFLPCVRESNFSIFTIFVASSEDQVDSVVIHRCTLSTVICIESC